MSKVKDILEDIKTFASEQLGFNEEEVAEIADTLTPESTEVIEEVTAQFVEAQLADGTAVQIEPDVAIGAVVSIEDPEAGFIAVPAGSYELADGRIIVVVEGGVIEDVQELVEEEEVSEEMEKVTEEAPAMNGAEIKKVIESVTTVFSQLDELKKEMDDLQIKFTEATEKNTELNGKFISAIEELASQPATVATQNKKVKNPLLDATRTNGIENLQRFLKK